jgi:hypothetical protein
MGTEERAAIRFPFYRGIRPPGTALQAHGRDRRSEQGSTHGEHQPSTPGRQGCLGAPLSPLPFRSRGLDLGHGTSSPEPRIFLYGTRMELSCDYTDPSRNPHEMGTSCT